MGLRQELYKGLAVIAGASTLYFAGDSMVRIIDLVISEPKVCKMVEPVPGCIPKETMRERSRRLDINIWPLITSLAVMTLVEGAAKLEE